MESYKWKVESEKLGHELHEVPRSGDSPQSEMALYAYGMAVPPQGVIIDS